MVGFGVFGGAFFAVAVEEERGDEEDERGEDADDDAGDGAGADAGI